jgi:hypothetical protein
MRRREFLPAELPPPGCWPRAQHGAMPVIGFLNAAFARPYARPLAAFLKGLGEAGYVDGRNVRSNTAGRRAKMTDCRHCRPTGPEEVSAFLWAEISNNATDPAQEVRDRVLGRFAQMRLHFAEGRLDWVEVRRIRRKINQRGPRRFDRRRQFCGPGDCP